MVNASVILNESDPIKREIWAAGYDRIFEDPITRDITIVSESEAKRIPHEVFAGVISKLSFKRGVLPDGTIHIWISEADGSAERFRKLITSPASESV